MSINSLKKNRSKLTSIILAILLLTTSLVTFIALADTDETQEPDQIPPEEEPIECREQDITLVAYKIECSYEDCLPNMGEHKGDDTITEQSLKTFVQNSDGCCDFVCGWYFQYGFEYQDGSKVDDPGKDFIGEASNGWTTFGPTDGNGKAEIQISIPEDVKYVWIREVLKEDYLPFSKTGGNQPTPGSDISAELAAQGDNKNYDNYEYIEPVHGETYTVAAFNTKVYDITGTVWQDNNPVNHMQDAEPGISDVVVELYSNNNLIYTTTTDSNGDYAFTNLPAGTYTVKIADSNFNGGVLNNLADNQQWHQADKDIGNDDIDSDGNMGTHDATVTLGPSADIDFGYYLTCVDIEKTGPEEAYAGDTVIYTYTVTNCGDIILHGGCDVYDDLINPETPINNIVSPGETWEFTQEYMIPEDACGEITNIATAIGHPKHPINGYVDDVTDEDSWTISLLCNPANLIKNGGFELPLVSGNWDIFNIIDNPELEWTVAWRDGQYQEPASLELQKNHLIDAHGGDQYAELDSDYGGPGSNQNGEAASVSISQTLSTCPDQLYNLTFYFAPRKDQDATQNKLMVTWNGESVDDLDENGMGDNMPISRDGNPSEWSRHTYHIKADTNQVTLTFTDMGESNSFGTFIDDVSLHAICGEEDLTYDDQEDDDNTRDDEQEEEDDEDEEDDPRDDDQEEPIIEECCVEENTNDDNHNEDPLGNGFDISILTSYTHDDDLSSFINEPENLTNLQTKIQQWNFCGSYEYLKLEWYEYVGKEAAYTNIFGYWLDQTEPVNPNPYQNGFIPLFKNGTAANSPDDFSPGEQGKRIIPITERQHISFGILAANSNIAYSSINSTNIEGEDHVLVYKLAEDESSLKYLLCMEDWDRDKASGSDFDDFIVILTISCTNEEDEDHMDNDKDGYTPYEGDCNDNDPEINPGMPEICGDEIDNDCDELIDEGCNDDEPIDNDEDGYTPEDGDCDDNDPEVNPGMDEICGDEIDNDCDGFIDEGCDEDEDDDDEERDDNEPKTRSIGSSKGSINTPPVAIIAEPFEYNVENQPITFDGSQSHDPDDGDRIISYEWNLGDGTIITGKTVTHTYQRPGNYHVSLTVQDNHGTHGSMEKSYSIFQPNRPPTTPEILGFFTLPAEQPYSFAALSDDPDGDDIQYIFDWGDGESETTDLLELPKGSAVNKLHNWDNPGEYTLTVTVSDGELSSSSEVQVTIDNAALNPMIIYGGIAAAIIGGLVIIVLIIRRQIAKPTH